MGDLGAELIPDGGIPKVVFACNLEGRLRQGGLGDAGSAIEARLLPAGGGWGSTEGGVLGNGDLVQIGGVREAACRNDTSEDGSRRGCCGRGFGIHHIRGGGGGGGGIGSCVLRRLG